MFSFVKTKRTPQMAWLQGMALSEEILERVVGGVGAESGEEADGPTAAEQMQEQLESAADAQSPAGGVSTSQEDESEKLLRQMEELALQASDDISAGGDTPSEDGGDFGNTLQEMPDQGAQESGWTESDEGAGTAGLSEPGGQAVGADGPGDPAPDQEGAEISAGESEGNIYSDIQSMVDAHARNLTAERDGRFSDPDTPQNQSQIADINLNELRSGIMNAAENRGGSFSIDKGTENTTAVQPNGPVLRIGESHAGEPEGNPESEVPPVDAQLEMVRAQIEQVNNERAKLGAMQNRLDHTINNLKVETENLSAAESRIRDVDMAKEMTSYTKNNILANAATSMLAQAASMPEN